MARFLKIGQRVFNCDYADVDMMDFGTVLKIGGVEADGEIYDDSIVLLKMDNGVSENEVFGSQVYIIDELPSASIGEVVCYEHANMGYDYYMPSSDENYMRGELCEW